MSMFPGRWSSPFWFVLLIALPLGCNRPPPPAGEEHPPQAPVKVAKAQMLPVAEWTELLGTTQPLPDRVARVSAPVEGRIVALLRDASGKLLVEGQEIKAGTVIAQLDTRIIREQVKQAEFAVRQADIEVKRLEALTMTATTGGTVPLVSRIELQRARLALEDTQSKQKALEEQVKLFTLTSPIDGRLGLVQAVAGQTLAVGAPVVEVVNLNEIDVLCYAPAHAAEQLRLGQSASLGEGLPAGKIAFLAVQAQADTGSFAVKARFPNADGRLRANVIRSVQVQTQPEEPRLMIPDVAVMEDQDPPAVIVVRNGKASKLQAVLGVRDRARRLVEIRGLEDPEKKEKIAPKDALYVVEGGPGLRDDDAVKVEEAAEKKDEK